MNLECSICFDRYNRVEKEPYLINPCGHCFCKSCLGKLQEQICPGCRGRFNFTTINRPILDLLDEQPTEQAALETVYKDGIQKQLDLLRSKQNEKKTEYKKRIESLKGKIQQEKAACIQALEKDYDRLMKELADIEKKFSQDCQKVNDEFSQKKQDFRKCSTFQSVNEALDVVKVEIGHKIKATANVQPTFDFKASILYTHKRFIGCIEEKTETPILKTETPRLLLRTPLSSITPISDAGIAKLKRYFFNEIYEGLLRPLTSIGFYFLPGDIDVRSRAVDFHGFPKPYARFAVQQTPWRGQSAWRTTKGVKMCPTQIEIKIITITLAKTYPQKRDQGVEVMNTKWKLMNTKDKSR